MREIKLGEQVFLTTLMRAGLEQIISKEEGIYTFVKKEKGKIVKRYNCNQISENRGLYYVQGIYKEC